MDKFTVTLADNHQTEVAIFCPEEPVGTLQFLHGMAEHRDRYQDLGQYFKTMGYKVIIHNHAGHGALVTDEDRGHFESMDQLVRHSEEILQSFKVDGLPVTVMGHSMGSIVARHYAELHPDVMDTLILSGTSFFDHKMQLALNMLRNLIAVKGGRYKSEFANKATLKTFNKKFRPLTTDSDWLSRNPENVQSFINDELTGFKMSLNAYKEILSTMKKTQTRKQLKKMNHKMPILLVSGKDDAFSNFGKGIEKLGKLYKRAGMDHVTIQLYSDARHEVLFEKNQTDVLNRIFVWLQQVKHV
ncbi:alpha/beta fold hydrolase [Macrococcus hajekii]|uniref:Alpha/beta fold hydrolase n=1 Tax=Macrococcus hajekii TaxID=198482 RepID=A0A4V3BEE0_9STAP|nr:alpha/beta fold hydrolase [Macrococcus hajekii]TDM03115.1 alpha/beta fold hydrolase [Macrococcus hajekii]GGA96104.1 lysophospholipase [Macrococcus hajekii]